MADCWFIVSVDTDGDVRILKRSKDADEYFSDPCDSVEYAVCEATREKPAGVYRMTLDVELVYEFPSEEGES